MSERVKQTARDSAHRRPATFRLDDPGVVLVDTEGTGRPAAGTIRITPESDPAQLPAVVETVLPARRGIRWGALLWTSVAGLVLLGLGLSVTHLIEDLFARSEGLGFLGAGFAAAAALAPARPTGWSGSPPSRTCTGAPPKCCCRMTAARAARWSPTSSRSRIKTRAWPARASRCRAMPTRSSTGPT
jgi:hypothetical protein